jgi:hypothetical protein
MARKPTPIAAARAAERCRIVVSLIQGTVRNKIAAFGGSAILDTFVTGESSASAAAWEAAWVDRESQR